MGFFGWGILAGNSLLSCVLGKNCLGGLTWLEIAGIFLPQQDLPGWSFVSGNSLVPRCLVASYLGGVSWVEVPCSAPAPSWSPFLEFKGFAGFPLSAEKFPRWGFLGGVSWLAIPCFPLSWGKLPRWTYLARKFWNLSSSARLTWVEFCEWKFLSFPLSGCKLIRWSFLGGSSLQCSCSFLEFPFWNLRELLACLFLQRNFLGGVSGWGILAGNSFLFFVLGKNCLGGLTWLEIAGIFLPQQDLPGWSFVSGNSLVPRCLVASYLGGVSWVEVPCSAPAPSWNSFFWNLRDLLASLFLQRNFLGGVSWVGYPGWQFLAFLCLGKNCLGGLTWLEIAGIFLPQQDLPGWSFVSGNSLLSFPLSGCKLLRWSFLGGSSLQCSCSFLEFPFWNLREFAGLPLSAEKFPRWSFWVGYPGWQFFPFLCVVEKLPRGGSSLLELLSPLPGWSFGVEIP